MTKSYDLTEEVFDTTFPESVEQLTPAWMTWALARKYPGVRVNSVDVVNVMAATATKVRVRLTYNEIGERLQLPNTLIVKGPFGKNVDDMEHTFTDETRGYKYVVSDIGINTPICYFAEKQGKNPLLIIEDLAAPDCIFSEPTRRMSFEEVKSILELLAKLHSKYWNSPELVDGGKFDWVLKSVSGWHLNYMNMVMEPQNWEFYLSLPRSAALPIALSSNVDRLRDALYEQISFYDTGPLTLGHGDAHTANIYFNHNGGGLLDWEMRRCPWYHDVTYFLITSLDVVDRRNWVSALLQYYLDRLAAHGVDAPSYADAFYCFRRELIYGYILFITNGDGKQFWSESMNTAVTVRYAMAAEDYNMMSAIERGI